MRVVVTGASGNVGTAVVEALAARDEIDYVVGVCRRPHDWQPAGVEWAWADVARDDLAGIFRGADAVVHLAWLFQPMRQPTVTWRANVEGSRRVFDASAETGVRSLVHASSVGAYSARLDLAPVDETFPTDGMPQAAYSREKAYLERVLDGFESDHPRIAVARMRPAFTFRRAAATQQRRLFLGPWTPRSLLRPGRIPILPLPADLRLQTVHTSDVADAYVAAVLAQARGPFNLAAEPLLGPEELADLFESHWHSVPTVLLRAATAAGYRTRLLPTAPDLVDLLMSVPVMDTRRARDVLGWAPMIPAPQAVRAFLEAPVDPEAPRTPPLMRRSSGPFRLQELRSGLGARP
jgi:UDP-glucose 4-epimerase